MAKSQEWQTEPEALELNAHSEPCVNQAYCLNGGTCYRLTALGRLYCQCAESFEGERCHLKTMGPDFEESTYYEELRLSLGRMLPVAIVALSAILFMVVLFCFYVCAKKCRQKYRNPSAVKLLIYKNSSVQTSISQLHLLGGDHQDHQCNGHLASKLRTRLLAVSTNLNEELPEPSRACLDLESGWNTGDNVKETVHTSQNYRSLTTVESDATEACREIRRDGTEEGIVSAAAEESAPRKLHSTNNSQESTTRCLLSLNDSNNNNEVLADGSSRQVTGPIRAHCNSTLHVLPPKNNIRNNCVQGSGHARTKAANDVLPDLYDPDPEATAL